MRIDDVPNHVSREGLSSSAFRRVAERLGHAMLLRRGDLHQLVNLVDPQSISGEVSETLDLLEALFDAAKPGEGA